MAGAALAIRLLGPVELWRGGSRLPAGGPTQRAVLAMLALHPDEPVPVDALADGIWGEGEEPAGAKGIQMHISRLRRLLKRGRSQPIETVPGGYRLASEGVAIDTVAFERALSEGRALQAAGDAPAAAARLTDALALWRGPALMDVRDFPFAAHAALRYDELRTDAAEEAIAARLALGEHQSLVPELQALVADNPYRERLHGLLMTALYRAGQQAAALQAYTAARSRLVLDLGVEPGPELQAVQQQVLAQDPALAVPPPTATAAGAPKRRAPPHAPSPIRVPAVPVLFGRHSLLAELAGMAAGERLITLTGAGGSGKTVLAIALLHRLAPDYPDGVAFVDLAAVSDPEQVLPALATSMGISPQGGSLQDQLAAVLAERRMLVVLDNCEHLLAAVPALAPVVEATAGLFIATSRAPLGLRAEHRVPVPPLSLPDDLARDLHDQPAVQLFRRAAATAGTVLDLDELPMVAAICRAVDGLPLAIELVAAQARVEAVAELAARLHARLPSISAAARDVPDRQRTMEATVAWSLERLSLQQQRAFSRLAVFAGGFDARGAAAVLERDRAITLTQLTALLDASLLVRQAPAAGQARFRMLEPLRDVARATASAREREASQRRHAAFIAAEVERLCPAATGIQRPEDLAQLRLEHPNLVAALEYLAAADPDRGVDLLVQLDDYWAWTGSEATVRSLAERFVSAPGLGINALGNATTISAAAAELLGDHEHARAGVARAVALIDQVTDEATLARIRMAESGVVGDSGDTSRAKRIGHMALAHAYRSGSLRLVSLALSGWAVFNERRSRYRQQLEANLREVRARSMALSEAATLRALTGLFMYQPPQRAQARQVAQEALDIAIRFKAPEFAAHLANNIGAWEVRFGSPNAARPQLLTALRTMDRIGHRLSALYPLESLAEVEAALGHWKNALILFTACDAWIESMGYRGAFQPDDVAAEAAVKQTAVANLGPEAAAEARALGKRMTYRDAVDFAFEINEVTPLERSTS